MRDTAGGFGTAICWIAVYAFPSVACPPENVTEITASFSSSFVLTGGAPITSAVLVSGSILPVGLAYAGPPSFLISGSATVSGLFSFQLQVFDLAGASVSSPSCSLSVLAAPVLQCPTAFASLSFAYSSSFSVTGGVGSPFSFSLQNGFLPPPLLLSSASGAVSGSPNTLGVFNFSARVLDRISGSATASCSIAVNAAPTVACPVQSVADVGYFYSSSAVTGFQGKKNLLFVLWL